MDKKNYTLYALVCPIENDIVYIGLTSKTAEERLKMHIGENTKSLKCNWIRKLKQKHLRPSVITLKILKTDIITARNIEDKIISEYLNNGHKLLNNHTAHLREVRGFTRVYGQNLYKNWSWVSK